MKTPSAPSQTSHERGDSFRVGTWYGVLGSVSEPAAEQRYDQVDESLVTRKIPEVHCDEKFFTRCVAMLKNPLNKKFGLL